MNDNVCRYREEDVLAFVAGELEAPVQLEMAEHLGECRECCDQAAEFRALELAVPDCCRDSAIRWHRFRSPFGTMRIAASARGLVELSWRAGDDDGFVEGLEARFPGRPVVRDGDRLARAERELLEYFEGERARFDVPVDLSGLGGFQRQVLEAARRLPFGTVVPYSELARRIGRPKAARAVGNALGRNPVAIIVPCHRIVRTDGSLGGYTGGLEYKRRLLEIEGRDDLLRAG